MVSNSFLFLKNTDTNVATAAANGPPHQLEEQPTTNTGEMNGNNSNTATTTTGGTGTSTTAALQGPPNKKSRSPKFQHRANAVGAQNVIEEGYNQGVQNAQAIQGTVSLTSIQVQSQKDLFPAGSALWAVAMQAAGQNAANFAEDAAQMGGVVRSRSTSHTCSANG